MILFPRFQLAEIEDQPWCPSWLREYSHASLALMWRTVGAFRTSSTAAQACDILAANLIPSPSSSPDAAKRPSISDFTFVDACAGAGGPSPILESVLNSRLQSSGRPPVSFVLTDLYPDLAAWRKIVAKSDNVTFVPTPVDATKTARYAPGNQKECRLFNLCFHHFDDAGAAKVLRSAVEGADAFVIFEMTQRNFSAVVNTTLVVLSPLVTTLLWFWWSPLHLIFTYLIPIVPIFFAVDGYVSCIRTRTPEEIMELMKSERIDTAGWEFKSGETKVLPPFGNLYWFVGRKTGV